MELVGPSICCVRGNQKIVVIEGRLSSKRAKENVPCNRRDLTVLSPLVLTADLVLLLGGEVVLDVEGLANLLGRLALNHVGDGLAADVEERLDVEVVGGQNDLKEHLLVDLHELLVPFLNVGGLAARVVLVTSGGRIVTVVCAPFKDLCQNVLGDVGDGDSFSGITQILKHVLDEKRALGDVAGDFHVLAIAAGKGKLLVVCFSHFEDDCSE
jgi:hypothetical protein